MLGFNALGRLALGQSRTGFRLGVAAGAFAETGNAATFKVGFASAAGSFSFAGNSAALNVGFASSAGAYSVAGNTTVFRVGIASAAGAYDSRIRPRFVGFDALGRDALGRGQISYQEATRFQIGFACAATNYVVTFNDAGLIRTGDDTDQVYGGVGHYLEALREARKREAITRKPPQPFVTRPPALRPYTPTQPAQMPDWSVLANPDAIMAQQQQAAIAQQQAAQLEQRKRREAQDLELLLLAA